MIKKNGLERAKRELKYAVVAKCGDERVEELWDDIVAVFKYYWQAEDFIKKCLPAENIDSFRIEIL
ncbi:hypothetical protein AALA22_14440 [Anaerovoracaceae bacterium 41-7]